MWKIPPVLELLGNVFPFCFSSWNLHVIKYYYTQIEDDISTDVSVSTGVEEDEEDGERVDTSIRSTKRPLTSVKNEQYKTLKKKKEAQENDLLEQAIICLKKDNEKGELSSKKAEDDDDQFGKFAACELRTLQDQHIKRQAKWKIQSALHEAQCVNYDRQSPMPWPNATTFDNRPMYNQMQRQPFPGHFTTPSPSPSINQYSSCVDADNQMD